MVRTSAKKGVYFFSRGLALVGLILLNACQRSDQPLYSIGGTVIGLRGTGLELQNNGGDRLRIDSSGNFTFRTAVPDGQGYQVTVASQPGSPTQVCTVANASGIVMNTSVANVQVNCSTSTYLFYQEPLAAVDPASPAVPVIIEPAGTAGNVVPVAHATYRPSPYYALVDRHYETVFYRNTVTGTLWKVGALLGESLMPTQISSENGVSSICQVRPQPDYANPDDAQIVYRLPGPDNICGNTDDFWRMIRTGMASADTPYPAFTPLVTIHNPTTGAIDGWLAINGSNLNAYDKNFSNPASVSAFTATPRVLATAPEGHVVLFMDNQLRVYNPHATPPTLSAVLGTMTEVGNARRDTTHVYFDDGATLYRLPLDGSASVNPLHTGTGAVLLESLTENRLIYWDDSSLKSIMKSGGDPVTLAGGGGTAIRSIGASGGKYYFHRYQWCGGWCSTAHVIDEDGTNEITISDAAWFAWTEPTGTSFAANTRDLYLDRVMLRNVLAAPYTIDSYAAASGSLLATLGALPATMNQALSPNFMRLPNHGNLLGHSLDNVSGSNDIVLANTDTNGSLVRITDSATTETVVGASGCSINPRAKFDPVPILMLLAALGGWFWRSRKLPAPHQP